MLPAYGMIGTGDRVLDVTEQRVDPIELWVPHAGTPTAGDMAHMRVGRRIEGPEAPESVAAHLTARHNGMSGMRRIPVRVKRKRLLKGQDGKRAAAVEVMLASPYIKDLINKGEIDGIGEIMEKSPEQGMKTFDQVIMELYSEGRISQEEALANADSRHNLEVKIRLESGTFGSGGDTFSIQD